MITKQKDANIQTLEQFVEKNAGTDIQSFLHPPRDPYVKNLDDMSNAIKEELKKNTPITIVGDYDCDGICSSSILYLTFKSLNVEAKVRLPRRFSEGYGLSEKIIDEIDAGLVVTVDNGIAANFAIQKAKDKGLRVFVLDHHLKSPDGYPNADIIVDPNAISGSEFNDYCGAGLAYRLAKKLIPENTTLLDKLCVLASIATVADVVPLKGDNRNIVIDGLKLLNQRKVTFGLYTLLNKIGSEWYTESDYGFKLGPIMNACGRLHDDGAHRAFTLLTIDSETDASDAAEKANMFAEELIANNEERKARAKAELDRARDIVSREGFKNIIIIEDDLFSEGIIGITAGKLAEEFHVPALVFTKHQDIYKGSGRTIEGIHLKNLLDEARDEMLGYGGHAGAAGMSVAVDNFKTFKSVLEEKCPQIPIDNTSYYDFKISVNDVHQTNIDLIKYAPYGNGNPKPVYYIEDFELVPRGSAVYRTMGAEDDHIKLYGEDVDAIGFGLAGEYMDMNKPLDVSLIGTLGLNIFKGKMYDQIEIISLGVFEQKQETTEMMNKLQDLMNFS